MTSGVALGTDVWAALVHVALAAKEASATNQSLDRKLNRCSWEPIDKDSIKQREVWRRVFSAEKWLRDNGIQIFAPSARVAGEVPFRGPWSVPALVESSKLLPSFALKGLSNHVFTFLPERLGVVWIERVQSSAKQYVITS